MSVALVKCGPKRRPCTGNSIEFVTGAYAPTHSGRCVTMQLERGVANRKKFIYTNVKIDKFDGKNQLHFQPCKTGESLCSL